MSSILNHVIARENAGRISAAAERAREHSASATPVSRVTLRYAAAGDARRLRHLAELESAETPTGEALIAEIDGRIRAALPLDGSRPIADPFHRGSELIELLRLRAAQLGRPLAT